MSDSNTPAVSLRQRARARVAQSPRISELWLGKPCVIVAWVALLLAILSPPHGSGLRVCWLQSATGLPCLGCGLTRSLSCGLRGLWAESWNYHPMGLLILALFAFTAVQSLLPSAWRIRLRSHMENSATVFNLLYLALVVVFVGYGLVRALLSWSTSGSPLAA